MENIDINRNWQEQKFRLKKKFAILLDSDLILEDGKKAEMFGRLQLKLGKTKEELDKILIGL